MSSMDFQRGQITQLETEKYHLKLMVARRNREINEHIKELERWISKHEPPQPIDRIKE